MAFFIAAIFPAELYEFFFHFFGLAYKARATAEKSEKTGEKKLRMF